MKKPKYTLLALLASSFFLTACGTLEPQALPSQPEISTIHYAASGNLENTRAYIYGGRTLLVVEGSTSFLTVIDENGHKVQTEQIGNYVRLPMYLPKFTVSINGHLSMFNTPAQKAPEAQPMPAVDNSAMSKLLEMSRLQIEEVQKLVENASKSENPSAELAKATKRIEEIEASLTSAASAFVRVSFKTSSIEFKPTDEQAKVLIEAGQNAKLVNVNGHTDSKIAGPRDAKIALGRALAARNFLVDNGVDAEKIKVFSYADKNFLVPNTTEENRTINRRVEIEFINKATRKVATAETPNE